jgi:hypothetical protein
MRALGKSPDFFVENTNIISINVSVHKQLETEDVRRNYVMTGAIWDSRGSGGAPIEGTLAVANTTMETFFQGTSCFSCHQGAMATAAGLENMLGNGHDGGVSHI